MPVYVSSYWIGFNILLKCMSCIFLTILILQILRYYLPLMYYKLFFLFDQILSYVYVVFFHYYNITGKTHAYLRDCHYTGRSYSIQDPRFDDLDPSLNHTTCIYEKGSSKKLVCVTICNTDFCNGPQIAGGSILQIQTWLNVLCAVVVILRHIS